MESRRPPSPSLSPLKQGMRFAGDPFGLLDAAREECGLTFMLRMPGDVPRLVTGEPEHIRTIFALPPDAYRMADQAIPLNLGRGSLLFLDGEQHRQQHRLLMPPLHGEHLRSHARLIEQATHDLIDRWEEGQTLSLLDEMQWVTLTVMCQCVLGVHGGETIDRLREVIRYWLGGPMSPFGFMLGMIVGPSRMRRFLDRQVERSPIGYPNPKRARRLFRWQRLGDAKAELMAMLRADLEECRRSPSESRVDVLAMLSRTRDEQGAPMELDDAVDELVTLLVGGYETTANALCWTTHHLLDEPEALDRVRREGTAEEGASTETRRPWLDACIKESLRLKPIAPVVNRCLVRPLRLGEYEIPAETILWPCIYLTHINEGVWQDPGRFDPQRFLGDRQPRANEWLAFGGGKRRCIGAAFAQLEMRIVLSVLLHRVELQRAEDADPHPTMRGITLSPRDRLRVVPRRILPR